MERRYRIFTHELKDCCMEEFCTPTGLLRYERFLQANWTAEVWMISARELKDCWGTNHFCTRTGLLRYEWLHDFCTRTEVLLRYERLTHANWRTAEILTTSARELKDCWGMNDLRTRTEVLLRYERLTHANWRTAEILTSARELKDCWGMNDFCTQTKGCRRMNQSLQPPVRHYQPGFNSVTQSWRKEPYGGKATV
jgi:hypothetical protein